ncbi:MAG: FAD-dependent oxidoreductase [Rhizobiaceae bacterium]|nr:FAD-dependent oxidoreductase [Rhizobiaceae bacterium]MCV0405127.1 FAD-dependent oxidoreductase [Rhizobiaceae bacterium]
MTAVDAGMVIVGAGECGARAALALREGGYQGRVTLVGGEPHPPYERPPLSKDAMTGDDQPSPRVIASFEQLADLRIAFLAGSPVTAIDREARSVVLADGRSLSYERLLLATGSSPRRLAIAPASPRIAYLRTFDDALALREQMTPGRRVTIVGGGFIGLELAASARRRGAEVTLIEAQERILKRGVPEAVTEIVHKLHAGNGVEVVLGIAIVSVEADNARVRIALADGRAIEADSTVIGIGAIPETGLAAAAGLAVDNGVAVDARLRSSDPDILAAGDCCSFPLAVYGGRRVRLEAWRNAQEQGLLAARNMLGAGENYASVPWFWSDQYEMSLHIAGLADEGVTTVRRDLGNGAFVLFHLADDGRLVAASGIGPGNSVAREVRLAEMLIARRAMPDRARLALSDYRLKSLLAA